MAGENEPAKLLLPYLQRADELQKHEPLVAYYCRLYAMERGLKIPQSERTKTTNALLVSLMKQLEKDKKSIKLGPEDNLYIEGFASNVFAKADKQDRAGRADLNTAKTFYAAGIFFEVLNQFGELQPDLEQKQKYAAWKAADIRKALKEGRKPIAGPPDGDKDMSIPSSMPNATHDLTHSNSDAFTSPRSDVGLSPQFPDNVNNQQSTYIPPGSSHPPPPPISRTDSSTYSQAYHHEQYPQEPHQQLPQNYSSQPFPQESHQHMQQNYPSPPFPPESQQHLPQNYTPQSYPQEPQHLPQDYPSHTYPQEPQRPMPQDYLSRENSSNYSYPDVSSYPSFSESSFPAASAHYPARHQGPETSYLSQSTPPPADYPSNSGRRNGISPQLVAAPTSAPAPTYEYDSNYQPAPEKIAEAHKAARFAVGALAFDDVPVAVDFLKKSLELLTNPSAKH